MDIVFLGGLFPKGREAEIYAKSKGPVQIAANTLQWHLVNGFDANNISPVKIINSLYVGAFPSHYKDIFIGTCPFHHREGANDIDVGFLNMYLLKHYSKYVSLKPHLKKWALDGVEIKIIIAYALTGTFVMCLKYLKKLNQSIKTCIIVPDLPEYMNTSAKTGFLYSILKKLEIGVIKRNSKYIDGYVLLTRQMKEFLGIEGKYVVVEGIAAETPLSIVAAKSKSGQKTVMYSGALNEKYGVLNLVEAFKAIKNEKYRLVLCGAGDAEGKIIKESNIDKRILFKGQLKREEVLRLQSEASVLVNPRQNKEEFTKYSFPSKNLEYLASGKCVIGYKLDGIPDEYDGYMFYPKDDSVKALSEKLREVCERDDVFLSDFGRKARDFVLKEKNSMVQTRKILDLFQ